MVLKALKALKSLSAKDVVRSQDQELLLKKRHFSTSLTMSSIHLCCVTGVKGLH